MYHIDSQLFLWLFLGLCVYAWSFSLRNEAFGVAVLTINKKLNSSYVHISDNVRWQRCCCHLCGIRENAISKTRHMRKGVWPKISWKQVVDKDLGSLHWWSAPSESKKFCWPLIFAKCLTCISCNWIITKMNAFASWWYFSRYGLLWC